MTITCEGPASMYERVKDESPVELEIDQKTQIPVCPLKVQKNRESYCGAVTVDFNKLEGGKLILGSSTGQPPTIEGSPLCHRPDIMAGRIIKPSVVRRAANWLLMRNQ